MRKNTDIDNLCNEAETFRRCFSPATGAQRHAVITRLRSGLLVRPHRGIYARAEYWNDLNAREQARHVIRSLAYRQPSRVFAGLSAAAILQLEYSWRLHRDDAVFIASPTGGNSRCHTNIRRIFMRHMPVVRVAHRPRPGGLTISVTPEHALSAAPADPGTEIVRVTSPARTLVDCGLRYPFAQAMPMFNSALRRGLVTLDEVMETCDGLHTGHGPVLRLLHYANPLCENGGESWCYATVLDLGFAVPQLQHVFVDPDAPWKRYRVDFVWHTQDGRIIVLEYDGTGKYVDPKMTGRRGVQSVVHDEREREDALRRAKVTTIIRTTFDEVAQRSPLMHKLLDADVPMTGMHPFYERRTDVKGREY
ncbi:type IV toxin-antitoxin system AbiEi family antitoxin domain-containing protein [Bifidobacterium simiiventris]|uniref:type IV toxin-antitoxin system AbiEi family antitoxin domain-containing protein n=1 Tax=Bifidobacterium simiiventris TaxID=2834434 RepID=UPI001F431480|nr:CTP synthase [Bifidobacterium simiiventris]